MSGRTARSVEQMAAVRSDVLVRTATKGASG